MLLAFDQISYIYPGSQQPAIRNLSLRIPTGKRCALIGQNGCGKTTLFLLANGLARPQQGKIFWQGEAVRYDRAALTQLRQQIGLVFQDPEQQLVAATIEEDISYGLGNLELPEPEIARRVQQALADFQLSEIADRPVHHLSLGQKKRVSIADVMVLQPTLLLLDEPTAYLDPRHTRNLITTLQAIEAAGTTIVIATHDLDFVYRWADWIFVLNQGQVVLEGSPATVFAQHPVMEALELGLPLAIELTAEITAFLQTTATAAPRPEQLQQQLWQKFRYD